MPNMLLRHHAMYYQDIGQGFPILFGHSFLWDRKMWGPQVEKLSEKYRCIVPDLWSHGYSEEIPQRPYSVEQLSEDFYHLMRNLGFDKFAIVGLSVGGMWGAQLALNYPRVVEALVLMDTFVGEEPALAKQGYFNLLNQIEKEQKFTDELVAKIVPYFFCEHTYENNPALVQRFKSHLKTIPHERLAGVIEMGHTIFSRRSLMAQLPELKMPLLIGCGEKDKPRPVSESEKMHQACQGSKLELIAQAGHIPSLENPTATTQIIEAFLAEAIPNVHLATA